MSKFTSELAIGVLVTVGVYHIIASTTATSAQYSTSSTRPAPIAATTQVRVVQPSVVGGSALAAMRMTGPNAITSADTSSSSTSPMLLLAAASFMTTAISGLFYVLGRYSMQNTMPERMTMMAMGGGDDDDNDLFGLLGLAETAGLPGAIAPLDYFDPLNLSKGKDFSELKVWRESELKHGRVAMLAVVGLPLAELFHPLFDGKIDGPGVFAVTRTELLPLWLALLPVFWFLEQPTFNAYDADGKKFKETFKPGNYGFDPLGLSPSMAPEYEAMQCKELSNGRLAMIAILGMVAQELVTGRTLF